MVPNLNEWLQVENMCAFENYRCEVTPFLKFAHILEDTPPNNKLHGHKSEKKLLEEIDSHRSFLDIHNLL